MTAPAACQSAKENELADKLGKLIPKDAGWFLAWAIGTADGDEWRIEKNDEMGKFEEDGDAWLAVRRGAEAEPHGLHSLVLEFLRMYSPREYARVTGYNPEPKEGKKLASYTGKIVYRVSVLRAVEADSPEAARAMLEELAQEEVDGKYDAAATIVSDNDGFDAYEIEDVELDETPAEPEPEAPLE